MTTGGTEASARRARRNVVLTAAIAGLGGLLFGYDTGIIAERPAVHQDRLPPRQLRPGPGRRRGADRRGRRCRDRRARRRHLRPPADDPALGDRLHRRRPRQRGGARARRPRRRPDRDRRRDRPRLGRLAGLHLRGRAAGEPRPPGQLLPARGDDRDPRRLPRRPRLQRDRRLALDARARLRAGAGARLRDVADAAEPALAGHARRRLQGPRRAGEDPRRRPRPDRTGDRRDRGVGAQRRQRPVPGRTSCSRR